MRLLKKTLCSDPKCDRKEVLDCLVLDFDANKTVDTQEMQIRSTKLLSLTIKIVIIITDSIVIITTFRRVVKG